MNLDSALPGFIAESADLLRDMESALLECAGGMITPDTINLIFRSAHTIKGSAGLFGLDEIVSFVHVVETVLDGVRLNRTALSEQLISLFLSCKDHIQLLVDQVGSATAPNSDVSSLGEQLLDALRRITEEETAGDGPTGAGAVNSAAVSTADTSSDVAMKSVSADWHVSIRFAAGVLAAGMDPLGFIRYLRTFCELRAVRVIEDGLPGRDEFQPEECHVGFELDLRTTAERSRIEAAFEFVREDCVLQITEANPAPVPAAAIVGNSTTLPTAVAARQKSAVESAAVSATVRVDAAKLDYLITRIGELIIAATGVSLSARKTSNGELEERASTLTTLVEQVRESALQLRMVKIGGTFDRFKRVVHDVSKELGKEISLVVRGEDTELDKTVVEQIGDPLTHLVRNAIDHGIEPVEVRAARGKSAGGKITLNAYHDSGSIVIEVKDDGGGLKRDKILAKALEKGLIQEDRTLTDAEAFNLIFEPGFSTADSVTNLSGRGVGMDVVKRNITALRGSVGVTSVEGQGTTVVVRLPLTLAIINGFQVSIGKSSFVLPLDAIEECIEFPAENGHDFTNLRGRVLPFIRLRELVGSTEPAPRRPSIVVVKHAGERAGIVVDALLGEFQTVIKPLGRMFRKVDYVSGSSILGTGEVALILDVPALVQQAIARARASAAA